MSAAAEPDDSLEASTSPSEKAPVFLMDGTRTTSDNRRILQHDFRNPATISQSDLRVVETLYQRYVQDLAALLSTSLRTECALKLAKVASLPVSEFCGAIPNPTCITLFRLEALRGVGVLELSLPVALAMADRLLGGKGQTSTAERQLTEIEMALMEDTFQIILSGWADLWNPRAERPQLRIIAHETNAHCLPMASASEVFVILHVEISMGESKGQLNLGVPFPMIEPAIRKIQESHNQVPETVRPKQVQWRNQYSGIAVPVIAEWKVREMPLSETLRIRTGDIIELPNSIINKASLRLSRVATFSGTVGIQNGNIAVQITSPNSKE